MFTHSHINVCLRIVIMGGDISNGNRIQIKRAVIAAHLSCNKKYKIFGQGTDYQAEVKKDASMVVRSKRQLMKADVWRCCQGWDVWRLPRSCPLTGARFFWYVCYNKLLVDDYTHTGDIFSLVHNKKRQNYIRWEKVIQHWTTDGN